MVTELPASGRLPARNQRDGGSRQQWGVVVPAHWPHVGLLTPLYLGVDPTSCQAERNSSALAAVVRQLRTFLGTDNIEKMTLLKLNSQLISGLADEALKDAAVLKAMCDAEAAASVSGYDAAAGEVISVEARLSYYWIFLSTTRSVHHV